MKRITHPNRLAGVLVVLFICIVIVAILHSPKPLAERLQTATGSFVLLCVNADEKTIAEGQHITVYPTSGYEKTNLYRVGGDRCAVMHLATGNSCYRVVTGTAVTGLEVVYATPTGGRGYQSVPRNPIGEYEINSGEFEWCAVFRSDNVPILRVGRVREGVPLLPPDAE